MAVALKWLLFALALALLPHQTAAQVAAERGRLAGKGLIPS